jgi:truncated hemoglobin YjbI
MTAEMIATPYDALGGETDVQRLVHRFHDKVEYAQEADPLRIMLGLEPSQEAGTL